MKASEVRKNWKSILDECVQTGKPIYFERAGTMFKIEAYVGGIQLPTPKIEPVATQQLPDGSTAIIIESTPVGENEFHKLPTDEVSNNIRPDIPPANEFDVAVEAGKSIPKCCTMTKPCKHWTWDEVNQWYFNYLTGQKREVEE